MSRLNLSVIKQQVRGKLHDSSISDTNIECWSDIAQDRIIRDAECDFLLAIRSISTVSTQSYYYVDAAFNKILNIVDVTNNGVLVEKSIDYLLSLDPDESDTGTPRLYANLGPVEYQAQLSAASKLKVVCANGSDSSQTLKIRSLVSGIEIPEDIALNGGTSAATSNTFDASSDLLIRLSAPCIGKVTVMNEALTETIAIIPPGQLRQLKIRIKLHPIPDDIISLNALVYRNPYYLMDDEDIPDLPPTWEDLVLTGTLVEAYRYATDFDVAEKHEALFTKDIEKLHKQQGNKPNLRRQIRAKGKRRYTPPTGTMPDTFGP